MIDTIRLHSKITEPVNLTYLDQKWGITKTLVNNINRKNAKDDFFKYTTQVKNFKFIYDTNGVYLEGSAPRFINNHNIETLKFDDIANFTYQLSDDVGFDVSNYIVTRLDITDNIEMDFPVAFYKRHFGKCNYFKKADFESSGIQYYNETRTHKIYDKLMEQAGKGKHIPNEYIGKKLLRYEYSIYAKGRKTHLAGINTLSDLIIPEKYLLLVDKWEYMFGQIEKMSLKTNVDMPYHANISYGKYLNLLGVDKNGGVANTIQDIKEKVELGCCSKSEARTLIKNINKFQSLYNQGNGEVWADRKEELIEKFKLKADENRALV